MANEVKPLAPTTGVATTASDVRPLAPTTGVKRTAGVVRPAAGAMGVEKTASEVRPLAPTTGDGTTARAVVPLATMIGSGTEAAGRPPAGFCSADDPTAKVTTAPALFSVGKDGMIVAPISPAVGLPAGVASTLTPLLEMVKFAVTPVIVAGGMTEASIAPANPISEVVELLAFSTAVTACELDGRAPSGKTVATVDALTAPPISVEIGKLVSAVSPEEPMTDVIEEPKTAT